MVSRYALHTPVILNGAPLLLIHRRMKKRTLRDILIQKKKSFYQTNCLILLYLTYVYNEKKNHRKNEPLLKQLFSSNYYNLTVKHLELNLFYEATFETLSW